MILECQNVSKSFQSRNGIVPALKDMSFSMAEHEFVCIVGPSGCGKTTLLKLIAGLLQPSSGSIAFGGQPPKGRPRTALVFQEHGLFPWMTVLDNVAFSLETRGLKRHARRAEARAFIEKVGLVSFAYSYPHELSVGMRQRVGIARSFVADPQILLMDEPLSSLDAQTRRVLQGELLRLWRDDRKSVLYVTHDIEEAVLLGDRVLVMTERPGRIRENLEVPVARPRDLAATAQREVVEIKWRIWKMIEEEVRTSLDLSD